LKVKVYVSGWITEADGTVKDVVVAEREDGVRIEKVYVSGSYDFEVEAQKLVHAVKNMPKPSLPMVKEVDV
jgi:hypothetical protein